MNTFIDLELMVRENKLTEKAKRIYLERIGNNEENSGLFRA
jgi:hypothetical protein